jgi:N-acetylglucosaminyl-diphospho-decaprenol L-rhamnosyltransferase
MKFASTSFASRERIQIGAVDDSRGAMRVCAVVVNFRGCDDTSRCVASLLSGRDVARVFIVDNGSHRSCCVEVIRKSEGIDDRVQGIFLAENVGYAGGSNAGIRAALDAGYEWIIMASNDVVFLPGTVAHLSQVARSHPSIGMISAVVYRADAPDTVYFAGAHLNRWTARTPFIKNIPPNRDIAIVSAVLTCAALVRREVFETVGLIDEKFFFQYDDIDLSTRCVQSGWDLAVDLRAGVLDKIGATLPAASPERTYYATRNRAYFIQKHIGGIQAAVAYAVLAGTSVTKLIYWTTRRDRARIMATLLGFRDFLARSMGRRGEPGSWDWRQVI